MRPLVKSYGVISTSTSSPVSTRMRFLRILPAVWPRTSWPFSSFTRNIALGRSSTTCPRISSSSSLAKRFLSVSAKSRGALAGARENVKAGRLDGQDGRAARLAGFESAMRCAGVLQGEALLHFDFHLAALNHCEQLASGLLQLVAGRGVIVERRAGQEERALLREQVRGEGVW